MSPFPVRNPSMFSRGSIKYYTGIGSRTTPTNALELIHELASWLCNKGWTLRSGGADGADSAFELCAGSQKEIYLPWKGFNDNPSPLYEVSPEAIKRTLEYHPAPGLLKPTAKKIMGRNLYQVLGKDMQTSSSFVVCWTPRGNQGGTGQAIRIALHHQIPVFNLRDEGAEKQLRAFVSQLD